MRVEATRVEDYNRIRVEPLTGAVGAEISNVDLREVDDDTLAELKHAWLAHKVLFFRDQDLTRAQHVAYGGHFGKLEIHPFTENDESHPEIIVLKSSPDKFQAAEVWHSDVTFRKCPPLGSVLYGREIPQWGGDTCFANMELAYELLSDELKEEIDDLSAVHSFVSTFGRNMKDEEREKWYEQYPDQTHPVVRTHPETGRKSLFINRNFTITIDGMSREESAPLRERLCAQATMPEIQCRFRWRRNSIAQWDNRCTQHYAVPDHGGCNRRVERVTLVGDRPV